MEYSPGHYKSWDGDIPEYLPSCERCGDTGYVHRPNKQPCPDCFQDNGPEEP